MVVQLQRYDYFFYGKQILEKVHVYPRFFEKVIVMIPLCAQFFSCMIACYFAKWLCLLCILQARCFP